MILPNPSTPRQSHAAGAAAILPFPPRGDDDKAFIVLTFDVDRLDWRPATVFDKPPALRPREFAVGRVPLLTRREAIIRAAQHNRPLLGSVATEWSVVYTVRHELNEVWDIFDPNSGEAVASHSMRLVPVHASYAEKVLLSR